MAPVTAGASGANRGFVNAIRRLARTHVLPVALLLLTALAMRLLVPAGYMIGQQDGHVAIIVCPGTVPADPAPAMTGMAGMHHAMPGDDHRPQPSHDRGEMPCAFAGLSTQALGAIDAVLLVALVAFVVALGVRPALPTMPLLRLYWRPPSRGPPATA